MNRRWLVPALAASAYALWNLVAWWYSDPQEFGDTYRYFGSNLLDIENPGITPVFVYTTVESPRFVTLIQVGFSILAWLSLATIVRIRLRDSWASWAVPVTVLAVSMTSPIWSWHMLLGSESLAVSAGVLWLSSVLVVCEYLSPLALTFTALAAGFLLVTRPQLFPVVFAVELVLIIWRWQRVRRVSGVVLPFLALLLCEAWAIARLRLLADNETFRFRYAIDNLVDKRDSFGKYVEAHMPTCQPLTSALSGPRPWDDVWQIKEKLIGLCPESFLWLRSPATQLSTWAADIPVQALGNSWGAMLTVALPIYVPDAKAMPAWMSSILFPDLQAWKILVMYGLLGALLALLIGTRPRVTILWVLGGALIAMGIAVYLFAVWGADGIELNRHLMPLTMMLPVVMLVFPVCLLYRRDADATASVNPPQVGTTSGHNSR